MQRTRGMVGSVSIVLGLSLMGGTAVAAAPPCSALITPSQAAAAMGVSAAKLGSDLGPGIKSCVWYPTDATAKKKVSMSIGDTKEFDAMSQLPSMPGRRESTPVSGIGDAAFQVTMGATNTSLHVKKGGVGFTVIVSGMPLSEAKAAEQTLATQILSKL
ncbi:hypothetical protein [Dyella humicola]|uniref:hypothetical protein n=1 Tax=Dyella humicola TaxID=2992126 RepID=UPI002254F941|nr:hypothetical protein [Dyella humicola]